MPIVNLSEPDKIFHGTTTRIHQPKINVKKASADTLRSFSVKPFPQPSPPKEPRHVSGTAIPNSTIRRSLLQVIGRSKDAVTSTDSKIKKEPEKIKKNFIDESSSSTIESIVSTNAKTSNSRILELKARQQKLLSPPADTKKESPIFEPRRPTLESIKEAIEKAKQLEINRHKNVGTSDDIKSVSRSDVSTSTEKKKKKKSVSSNPKVTDSSESSAPQTSKAKTKNKKKKKIEDREKYLNFKAAGKKKP